MTTKGIAICFIAAMIAAALAYRLGFEAGSHARSMAYPEANSVVSASRQGADTSVPEASVTAELEQVASSTRQHDADVQGGQSIPDPVEATMSQELAADARALAHSKQHLDEYDVFIEGFAEEDTDWQAQTYISDFIELHQWRDDIQLYKLSCSNTACVMDGEMTGDHQRWEEVVDQMRKQDWWAYTSSSSTSSTDDDGVTYFRVFVTKQP